MLPDEFITRLYTFIPKNKLQSVLDSFTKSKPVTFRINTLKLNTETLLDVLNNYKINFKLVPWYKDAFILEGNKIELMETDQYKNGQIYIQSLSSMIPALVVNPKRDETICDLTAAPGSKTTQLAALMKNRGKIVANDLSRARIFRLKDNLKTQGVTNTEVISFPGQALWKKYPEQFDKVLVDVPCTMEGRFSTLDPDSFKDWKPKKVRLLSKLQKYLIRSAVSLTKPGGLIVYSTCTLEPEENEEVIDWILKKENGNVTVETIDLKLPESMPGLATWKKKTFNAQLSKTLRILPSETMEGFYIAVLRKKNSSF